MSEMFMELPQPTEVLSAPIPPIHGSIVKAVCAVKSHMEAVAKSQRNQHGGYNFASADDIYAFVSRKMGDVGLISVQLEDGCDIVRVEKDGKTSQWAKVSFSFVLATEEATWSNPRLRRTLFIQVTGPQTFQAAQSYCDKAFLRSIFKLPTGGMDLDGLPQSDTEEGQIALSAPAKRKSSSSAKKDGTDKTFNALRTEITSALNAEHLKHLREAYAEDWNGMPARWVEILDNEYEDKMESFASHRDAAE